MRTNVTLVAVVAGTKGGRVRVGMFLVAGGFPGRDHGATLRAAVDATLAAERAGFDDVWVAEHHFMSYGLCPSAVTLAGYLLGATSRITVGTAVSVLPVAHPVALAEQALLLDRTSGGRFRLGVGRGGPWVDLEVFGSGASRHAEDGYAEALDLLLSTLDGGTVAADGGHFRFRPVPVTPEPRPGTTHGGVAPVLATTSGSGIAAAADRGLPMLLGMHADDTEKARYVAQYAERAAARTPHPSRVDAQAAPASRAGEHAPHGSGAGAQPPQVSRVDARPRHVSAGVAHLEDRTDRAREVVRTHLPGWLGPGLAGYVRLDGAPRTPRDPHEYTDLLCRLHAVGSPEHAVDVLTASATATGIEHVVLLVDTTGDPDRTAENIARLGADVLPRLPGR